MDILHHYLQSRCLESLGTYLSEQMVLLMDISEDPCLSESTFRRQYLVPFCTHLETSVLNIVRFYPSLAKVQNEAINMSATDISNQVTDVLLRSVISSLDPMKSNYGSENPRSKFHIERRIVCEQVAADVAAAVFHNLTTKLDFYRSHDYIEASKSPKTFVSTFLEKCRSKLKQLTSFRLRVDPEDRNILSSCLQDMQNLQEFYYHEHCEDFIIGTLASYCKQLRKLGVRDSKHVTDSSVALIVSFKELRTLDINGTEISSNGITQIIQGLRVIFPYNFEGNMEGLEIHGGLKGNILSSLGASLKLTQIKTLSSRLPFLISLQITLSCDISLHSLADLHSLKSLDIGFDVTSISFPILGFSTLQEVLDAVGSRLEKLTLREVYGTDLVCIADNCNFLKFLSLQNNHCEEGRSNPALLLWGRKEVYPVPTNCDELISSLYYLPHVKSWSFSGVLWRSELLLLTLFQMVESATINEISINNFDVKIFGNRVFVTSMLGVSFFVDVSEFYPVLKDMFESGRRLDMRFERLDS